MFLRIYRDILLQQILKITFFMYFYFDGNAVKGNRSKNKIFPILCLDRPLGFQEDKIARIARKLLYEDGTFVSL